MGSRFSLLKDDISFRSQDQSKKKVSRLLAIKNHPDRPRRRSSAVPFQPAIKEEKLLEDLCRKTNIEPDVPVDDLEQKAVQKLTLAICKSERRKSTKIPDDIPENSNLEELQSKTNSPGSATPSLEEMDKYIEKVMKKQFSSKRSSLKAAKKYPK